MRKGHQKKCDFPPPWGAECEFEEGSKGSLETGKAADLVVLAEDLSRVLVERLRDVGVVMTVVVGEIVYEA